MEYNGSILWTLNHDAAEGKPYIHPMAATNGTQFTGLRPEDHPWHRGVWFSWKYINGVNYWEESRETGLSQGRTRLLSTERTVLASQAVQIDQTLDYAPGANAEAVLAESRKVVLSAPDEAGVYTVDWSAEFRALTDVKLDRTPIEGEPNGKSYGGYAGLSVRMNKNMHKGGFINQSGLPDREGHGKASDWVLYKHESGSSLLFMDHPDNLNYPAKWYVVRMPYYSPSLLFDAPLELAAGETLSLKYRMVVSPTAISAEAANALSAAWASKRAKVLIVTGANNHNWKASTPVIEKNLEATGRFEVDVELNPETLTAAKLAQYDVLLSNWNAFGKNKPAPWPEAMKQAYVDFVRNGGGHVVVHAGSSSHYDWDDYHAICLATWRGRTGHGEQHEFPYRATDTVHPITEGLELSKATDELWFRPMVHPNATVLAEAYSKTTGNWEPSVVAGSFGESRCFTILLGHGDWHMTQEPFKGLLNAGTEWVAGMR